MVSGKGLMYENVKTESLLHIRDDEGPVAFQIFGRDPVVMKDTARRLAGYGNVILDINMGCPVPKIVKNGEGSALMKEPELAGEVIRAVVEGTDGAKPVTVKMRAGWDEDHLNAPELAKIAEQAGASAVTVHGRTRMQYYTGKADRSIIKKVKESVSIPVIGNGDIMCAEDAVSMMEETGCDAVMIGRGMQGNPWIFRDMALAWEGKPVPDRPSDEEIFAMIMRHFELLSEEKGERIAFPEMKKHVYWYVKGRHGANEIKRRINAVTSAGEMREILYSYFDGAAANS
jgi:tRNA-dihydrouridine synthase B